MEGPIIWGSLDMQIPDDAQDISALDQSVGSVPTMPTDAMAEWGASEKKSSESRDAASPPDGQMAAENVSRIHGYKNYTASGPISYCGQAAAATLWDYWGFDPGYCGGRQVPDPHFPSGPLFWNDVIAVDAIRQRFPNDVGGMSPARLMDAVKSVGLQVSWGWGPHHGIGSIAKYVQNSVPIPTVCLLKWGQGIETLHWVVVFAIDNGQVWFTNPAMTEGVGNPNDSYQLGQEKWRVAGLPFADFENRWSWTGLTKTHIVAWKT